MRKGEKDMDKQEIMRTWQEHLRERERVAAATIQQVTKGITIEDIVFINEAITECYYKAKRKHHIKLLPPTPPPPIPHISGLSEAERAGRSMDIIVVHRNNERKQGKIKTVKRTQRIRIVCRQTEKDVVAARRRQAETLFLMRLAICQVLEKRRMKEYPLARKPSDIERLERIEQELKAGGAE